MKPVQRPGVLAESCAKSRNKQGESREPGRVESGIKEARVGKQGEAGVGKHGSRILVISPRE